MKEYNYRTTIKKLNSDMTKTGKNDVSDFNNRWFKFSKIKEKIRKKVKRSEIINQ